MAFLAVNNFFWCVLKNTEQNNNRVFIVFKAESELKHKENFFLGVFLQKPKLRFFGGKNKIVLKLRCQICISAFVFYCTKEASYQFSQKNIIIQAHWKFLKMKTLMRMRWCSPKFWIWTSKIMPDL